MMSMIFKDFYYVSSSKLTLAQTAGLRLRGSVTGTVETLHHCHHIRVTVFKFQVIRSAQELS